MYSFFESDYELGLSSNINLTQDDLIFALISKFEHEHYYLKLYAESSESYDEYLTKIKYSDEIKFQLCSCGCNDGFNGEIFQHVDTRLTKIKFESIIDMIYKYIYMEK